MIKKVKYIVLLVAVLSTPMGSLLKDGHSYELWSSGAMETGRNFSLRCRTNVEARKSCESFLVGLSTGIYYHQFDLMWKNIPKSEWMAPMPLCSPNEFSVGQLLDIVLKYIDENPANSHFPIAQLSMIAIKEAWPCS